MSNNIFEKNLPSINYISKRWPNSKIYLQKYFFKVFNKPDFFKLTNLCFKELKVSRRNNYKIMIRNIASKCSTNFYFNKFHDLHHFKAVLLISTIFAIKFHINKFEAFLVIIISLTHDMGHLGKRILKKPYFQEKKTIVDLEKILFKFLLNGEKWRRIKKIILNTYFNKLPEDTNDRVEKIILFADISSSLIFGKKIGLLMAKKLKLEINYDGKSSKLYDDFLKRCKQRKLICLKEYDKI
tara:strand:- start:262 stop:981 length:720 start_codon:yes stop_codon:yes gene_type:complete